MGERVASRRLTAAQLADLERRMQLRARPLHDVKRALHIVRGRP
jgi:hypothetical protein